MFSSRLEDRRLVLAFFPEQASQQAADAASQIAKVEGARNVVLQTAPGGEGARPFHDLALPGEILVVVTPRNHHLSETVQSLQSGGARSIFLTVGRSAPQSPAPDIALAIEGGLRAFLRRVEQLQHDIETSREYLVESVRLGHSASPAAQWIIDNAYVVQLIQREVRKEAPAIFKWHSRVRLRDLYALAHRMPDHLGGGISEETLTQFLRDAQTEREFDSQEIWAFPLLLKIALIESLSGLAVGGCRGQQLREAAFLWADRLAVSSRLSPEALENTIRRLGKESFAADRTFVTALGEQLQDQQNILQALEEHGLSTPLAELVRAEHERETSDALVAANTFGTLRTLSHIEFRDVFNAVSRSEAELTRDPSGVYGRSDFMTRDHARRAVAWLARKTERKESEVSRTAIALAAAADRDPERQVLHYLIGDGAPELERRLSYRPSLGRRFERLLKQHGTTVYVATIMLLTACFCAVALGIAVERGVTQPTLLAILAALAALPLSELSIQILHSLVISAFPPNILPKLDFRDGIPEEDATLVVVPMMLTGGEAIRRRGGETRSPYPGESRTESVLRAVFRFHRCRGTNYAGGRRLLKRRASGIAALNKTIRRRPISAVSPRTRNGLRREQEWIGRERKRGKIEELNAYLMRKATRDILAEGRLPKPIRYVITLDADTQLPPGAGRRMMETIAHPLNQVQIDPATRRAASAATRSFSRA